MDTYGGVIMVHSLKSHGPGKGNLVSPSKDVKIMFFFLMHCFHALPLRNSEEEMFFHILA